MSLTKNKLTKLSAIVILSLFLWFSGCFSGQIFGATQYNDVATGSWNNPTTWSPNGVPGVGDSVVIDSGTITLDSSRSVESLIISGSGILQTAQDSQSNLAVSGTFLVNTSGTFIVRRSSISGEGAGQTITAGTLTINGTIHADGQGFSTGQGPGKSTGDENGGSYGGRGGDGELDDGVSATYGSVINPASLGSGGSAFSGGGAIFISSSGIITVNGILSAGGLGGDRGAGSGGSINIIANVLTGSGTIRANGGNSSWYGGGGGGRISLGGVLTDNFTGTLQANGGSSFGARGHAGTIYFNSAKRSNLILGGSGNLASLRLGADDNTSNLTFNIITIQSGGILEIDGNPSFNSGNGGTATLSATTIDVQSGGTISANGMGFSASKGPGKSTTSIKTDRNGGSYGGLGGDHGTVGGVSSVYGSGNNPIFFGSGGANHDGGGAIIISTSNTLNVNGTISADGASGGYGAGSGGSINIIANTLTGSGTIRANGGNSSWYGGGGGGRIAINYTTNSSSITPTTTGGSGNPAGSAGTVYVQGQSTPTPTAYTLATLATNGTITRNPNQTLYNSGTAVILTAEADTGYTFTSWSGDASGSTNPVTVTITSNKNITANFIASQTPVCTSFTYSDWSSCQSNNTQTRTVLSSSPLGCTGGSPALTQSCIYTPSTPGVILPTLPQTFEVPYQLPNGGRTWNPTTATEFQNALNGAALGDVIILQAGTTYTGSFTLPKKTTGSGWIYIISSRINELPAGLRVSPEVSDKMAKILTTSRTAISTANGAHHYRFAGIEVSATGGIRNQQLFFGGWYAATDADIPSYIWFDRCYFHIVGNNLNNDAEGAFMLDGKYMAIFDTYIENFKCNYNDGAYGIKVFNGPGPYKIVNNYIESSGINFMSGGEKVYLANNIPSDIEFKGNHVNKKPEWARYVPGTTEYWKMKNAFELKYAQRVLIEGNVFSNVVWNPTGGQRATGIVLKVSNAGPLNPNATTRDVTFRNNIVRDVGTGLNFGPMGGGEAGTLSMARVLIENNIFDNIKRQYMGPNNNKSTTFHYARGVGDLQATHLYIRHNLMLLEGAGGEYGGYLEPNTDNGAFSDSGSFENNIFDINATYSLFVSGDRTKGVQALLAWNTNTTITKNVFIKGALGASRATDINFPSVAPYYSSIAENIDAVGFTDYRNYNYKLTSSSPYKDWGSDGRDPGPDMDALNSATFYAVNGEGTYIAPTCTSFTYSEWSVCQSNSTQSRTVSISLPSGCIGGSPVIIQSCTYTPYATSTTPIIFNDGGGEVVPQDDQAKIQELLAIIAQLQAQIAQILAQRAGNIPSTFSFEANLKFGQNSNDVLYLQIMLNKDPATKVASSGYGSPGRETIHFGPATKQALMRFQQKYNIIPVSGYFGPKTMLKMNQLLGR